MILLDDIDRKIISQLQLDGRTSLEKLAKIVGYTSMGVKKRVKKLLERKVIKVSALINIKPLKLYATIVLLEVESAEAIRKLLKHFENCPRVVQIFTLLGGYNLIAILVAEDWDTLESISMSLRSGEGIRRFEFYPVGNVHYSPFLQVREYLTRKEGTINPCEDCGLHQIQKCVGCPMTLDYNGPL